MKNSPQYSFKFFQKEIIVRLVINILIFTVITQLYTIFLELKVSVPALISNAVFIILFNLPLTVIAPYVLMLRIQKSYIDNNDELLKKRINRLSLISTLLIIFQGFLYCLLISIAGYFKYPEKYNSVLEVMAFIITISYTYQIIPAYFNHLLISDMTIKMRLFLFTKNNIIFKSENKRIWKQILVSLVIVGVMPVFSIIINLLSNGYFRSLNSTKGGFLAELIIMFISIILTVVFVTRSFTLPINNLVESTRKLQEGNIDLKSPVIVGNEIGDLTIHFNNMTEGLKDRELIKDVFGKMVDPLVRDHIMHGNIKLGGVLTDATILFSDIRNFTGISEKMSPESVVAMLNEYFDMMSSTITHGKGFVNKFIGDALMVVFGVPLEYKQHADESIKTAIQMQLELKKLNTGLKINKFSLLETGIGIHTGELVAGNIGSSNRMEYTVIGDTVNLSSRLEGLTKLVGAQIVCSSNTIQSLNDPNNYKYRFILKIKVKGRKQSVIVYEILNAYDDDIIETKIKISELLRKPIEQFYNKEFESALEGFIETKIIFNDEKLIDYYMLQCNILKSVSISDDWDSIET